MTDSPEREANSEHAGAAIAISWRSLVLRPADQTCLGVLTLLALAAVGWAAYRPGLDEARVVDLRRFVVLGPEQQLSAGYQLDMNRADWPEWTLLPRIGETLARRLVASREQAGSFQSAEDLRRVPGIGPKTLAKMRPYLLPARPAPAAARP